MTQIQVFDIQAGEMGGDPCYWVDGHVDLSAFVAQVNILDKQLTGETNPEGFSEGDARHVYSRKPTPGEVDPDIEWKLCKATDPGAMPMTIVHP